MPAARALWRWRFTRKSKWRNWQPSQFSSLSRDFSVHTAISRFPPPVIINDFVLFKGIFVGAIFKKHLEKQIKGVIIVSTVAVESASLASDSLRLLESLGQLPEPAARPFFITVSGLPGTGKSYFCRRLVERLPAILLESDALRKTLYDTPVYSAEESAHLFRAIHLLVERLLSKGISVVLDATNLSERNREYLYGIADRLKVKLIMVRVSAPPELVRQRLEKRRTDRTGKSDADWQVYQKMKTSVDEIRRKHYAVDTSQDISPAIDRIAREALH
jgi:predicted kinase